LCPTNCCHLFLCHFLWTTTGNSNRAIQDSRGPIEFLVKQLSGQAERKCKTNITTRPIRNLER
jgi:hypothetical protein